MKIQSIGNFLPVSRKNITSPHFNRINQSRDVVSFTSKKDNTIRLGLFGYLKHVFHKEEIPQISCMTPAKRSLEELSDEEIKSEKIKEFVGLTLAGFSDLEVLGKNNQRELNSMLRLGADNFYEGVVEYNSQDRININFGDMNEELDIPKAINVWEDGQYAYTYEIFEKEPLKYRVTIFADKLQTTMEGIDKDLTRFLQYDKSNRIVKEYSPTPNGFRYLYGQKKSAEKVEILKRLYFDFENIAGCIYAEGTDEGIELYCYDVENDLWEPKYLLEVEEEPT